MSSSLPYERYVPQGRASLVEDAPGWGEETQGTHETNKSGPACWKCRGSGAVKPPKGTVGQPNYSDCSVCDGRGRLAPKRKEVMAATNPGTITRGRRCPYGWIQSGPAPHALTEKTKWSKYVEKANQGSDIQVEKEESMSDEHVPNWMPTYSEELCNLVGTWRILQRVGSHRWTTDDLVTAYVASREVTPSDTVEYLDLGTGNASVLQMVTWALLKDNRSVDATGVEARLEAVNLARRSLSFNLGKDSSTVRIVHGDFRDVFFSHQFDLVTGTPPYFRVDFAVTQDVVISAVINQGGMPTGRQSAPARCEFRGGIEAYCEAASRVLRPRCGRFVVCENWLNHDRVVAVAEQCNLCILTQVQVHGRQGRDTLFSVYVMKLRDNDLTADTKREDLTVRDRKGNWTIGYRRSVLNEMSIPDPADSLSSGSTKCV